MTLQQAAPSAFIQFCARTYGRPGVRPLCLALQDNQGLNVNCLLLAAWASREGYRLDEDFWRTAAAAIAPIETKAVRPIRLLRRGLSADETLDRDLRGGLKRLLLYAELRAEQAVETVLHRHLATYAPRAPASLRDNLLAYAGRSTNELEQLAGLLSEPME